MFQHLVIAEKYDDQQDGFSAQVFENMEYVPGCGKRA